MNKLIWCLTGLLTIWIPEHFCIAQKGLPCGMEYIYNQARKTHPETKIAEQELEEFTRNYINSFDALATTPCNKIIPVVVHIIHNNGSENISDAQVNDAINILNLDFQKRNADTTNIIPLFKGIAANIGIEFRLAKKDPTGAATTGITRHVSALTNNADDNVKTIVDWDPARYMNIWVVKNISFGAGGYAYFPGLGTPGQDGIVVVASQFGGIGQSCGSNYCKRTLTHEVGHYLNLSHVWGNNASVATPSSCSNTDGVDDTPPTIGTDQSCNLSQNTCGFVDNVQNFMDYSSCTKMFTEGQKLRMLAALFSTVSDRLNLWSAANLAATGVNYAPLTLCGVDIYASLNTICTGIPVTFTNLAWSGTPTSYTWSFPGGTPASSTASSPTVVYNSGGMFDVSLTAKRGTGTASITKNKMITVGGAASYNNPMLYSEGFETGTIPNNDWSVINTDNGITWKRVTTASSSGTGSIMIDNSSNISAATDEIISPGINFSVMTAPKMTFRLAFAQKNTSNTDKLQVLMSTNCGQTWSVRYNKFGSGLATAPVTTGKFTPVANDWRTETIVIPAGFSSSGNVKIKFLFTSGGGNNVYIDDINIFSPVSVDEDMFAIHSFSLAPNPMGEMSNVLLALQKKSTVSLKVFDLLGKELIIVAEGTFNAGDYQFPITKASGLSKGVYIVNLLLNNQLAIKKLIVE